ncbi:MAG: Zn-dependent exopeptidase M28 [Eubacterium sp.]|nr:Zn-dependent exopeptidase M28 [Eubacterium sp.]
MHKLKILSVSLLCLLPVCLLSACGQKPQDRVEDTLKILTSAEYEGRLYGTKGNDKALSYLSEKMESYGFAPFAESYSVPFEAELPTVSSTSLSILGDDGAEIMFQEGEDYFSSLSMPLELTGTIPEQMPQDGVLEIPCSGGMSLAFKVSRFRFGNYSRISGREEFDSLTVGVSSEAMDEILLHAGESISYRCEGEMGTLQLQNAMGVLKGKDSSRALVIGAHVDHMGMQGDALYAGAVDNASGASALLAVCRELAGQTPDVDLIACFWNAEEEGQQGSAAGAGLIAERYEEYGYINMDCLGMKGAGNPRVTTNNRSTALRDTLAGLLEQAGCHGIEQAEESMMSDHYSFAQCPAVDIGQGTDVIRLIHTPEDTAEQVDCAKLEQLAGALAQVVMESSGELFAAADSQETMSGEYADMTQEEKDDYIKELRQRLAYDEYIMLPGGAAVAGYSSDHFDSLKEVRKVYPQLFIKKKLGKDCRLEKIRISALTVPADGQEEEYGRILKRKFSADDILFIELIYKKGEYTFGCHIFKQYNMENMIKSSKSEKLDGRDDVRLCYSEDGILNRYAKQSGNGGLEIYQGRLLEMEDGFYGYNFWDEPDVYTKEALLSTAELVEKAEPLVQIDGREIWDSMNE